MGAPFVDAGVVLSSQPAKRHEDVAEAAIVSEIVRRAMVDAAVAENGTMDDHSIRMIGVMSVAARVTMRGTVENMEGRVVKSAGKWQNDYSGFYYYEQLGSRTCDYGEIQGIAHTHEQTNIDHLTSSGCAPKIQRDPFPELCRRGVFFFGTMFQLK
jgi:hypothetical protein